MRSDSYLRFSASPLLRFGSAGSLALGISLSALLGVAAPAQEVQAPFSTHDWTVSTTGEGGIFNEAWADVKAPGDGMQYAVGTIEVNDTANTPMFSGSPVSIAGGAASFTLAAANRRQVVILQATDTNQAIMWQSYFYGLTTGILDRATNARGISVWAAADPEDARVAICGETYDAELPLSQDSFGAATVNAPTGFFAVFDGNGTLLWSRHMFGVDPTQSCAITDLSIRVDAEGNDVVTYCGISSHGVPAAATPLSPVDPFPATVGNGGATNQGIGQWDGIVGRVSRSAAGVQTPTFHSIVGGPEQDGLFGIAEIEADRFIVVGGTRWAGATPPPAGFEFPLLGLLPGPFDIGVAVVFDFDAGTSNWLLESTLPLGSSGEVSTLARDVLVLRDGFAIVDAGSFATPALHSVAIVGSTNDPDLFAPFLNPVAPAMQGPTDGFVAIAHDLPGSLTAAMGRYHGGDGNDGLTGVQGWNEFTDYVVVTGFTEGLGVDGFGPLGVLDISVESFYVVTDPSNPAVTTSLPGIPLAMRSLRRAQIGGSSLDRPAAMGVTNAMTAGLPFATGPLGEPAGGGITVDESGRVNVVGQTLSTDYPVFGAGRPFDAGRDAVRTVFDLIPPGVGRTDGTGAQAGFTPVAGFTGGTTPACALSPFGKRIGDPAPAVPRMLIEYEGPQPAQGVAGGAILVVRPTAPILPGALASSGIFAAFQFDFPGVPAPPFQLTPGAEGAELWTTGGTAVVGAFGFGYPNQSFVINLFPLPIPPVVGQPMVVQVACWVPSNVPGGVGAVCTTPSFMTTTPAMWLPL